MRTLFLLTARGGSKGIPRKNLKTICGTSLIGYKVVGARQARSCDRLLVSTDDKEIRDEAVRYGAEAPFLRPAELATDEASSTDVVYHAMQWVSTNLDEKFDAVMLLEPTTPFTRPADYDRAVDLMAERNANLVVGLREMEVSSGFVGHIGSNGQIMEIVAKVMALSGMRRQDQAPEYTMNGGLYLFRWEYFMKGRRIYGDPAGSYGIVMPPEYSIEIDSPRDLAWAEFLVERGHVDGTLWNRGAAAK